MQSKFNTSEHFLYCVVYTTTILCNKYVLSSLGFQYPTVFQAWQTFAAIGLIHLISGNVLKQVTLSEIIPWMPAMMLYVGSIYSGSKALSHLSIPIFLLSHGASDVILILFDNFLPSGIVQLSMPLKMSGMLFALWSAANEATTLDLMWLLLNCIFAGFYRTAAFWYTTPQWPYSGLTVVQRQYLNNLLGLVLLLPLALFLGHHMEVQSNFQHLGEVEFYMGCLCSGILGWGVNFLWGKINIKTNETNLLMLQLGSKIATFVLSLHLFPVPLTSSLCLAVFLGLCGDIVYILGTAMELTGDHGYDISDVLIGS